MRGKTILPLAVSSAQRMPGFPDVPTLRELGYPDMVVTTWFGFAAPAALPADITQQMNTAIGEAMDDPKVRERLMNAGFELEKMLPSELSAYIKSELTKWGPLSKKLISSDAAK
jgi:tripartite-type tricarboxylate transporter receptor subunit TctC